MVTKFRNQLHDATPAANSMFGFRKVLHQALSEEAETEGVSLNMPIVNRLSKTMGR